MKSVYSDFDFRLRKLMWKKFHLSKRIWVIRTIWNMKIRTIYLVKSHLKRVSARMLKSLYSMPVGWLAEN